MAKNLIKRIAQSSVYYFSVTDGTPFYPYSAGQKFFTDEGMYYEDVGGYRCAVIVSKLITTTDTLATNTLFANNFVILNTSGTYSIYYYNASGVPNLISGGGSSLPDGTDGQILVNSATTWITSDVLDVGGW